MELDKQSALGTSGGSDIRFFCGGWMVDTRHALSVHMARAKKRIQRTTRSRGWCERMAVLQSDVMAPIEKYYLG